MYQIPVSRVAGGRWWGPNKTKHTPSLRLELLSPPSKIEKCELGKNTPDGLETRLTGSLRLR